MEQDRGQAVVGFGLLIGITAIGVTSILILGGMAIDDYQQTAQIENAKNSMTQFDTKAATVALGDSPSQEIKFGTTEGTYTVKPDTGRIMVIHQNFDGGNDSDGNYLQDGGPDDDDMILYENTLGAVVYENNGRSVAYQGGGVWYRDERGGQRMISPPEVHYRGSTLTMPVIRVNGDASATDSLSVTKDGSPRQIYANQSRSYYDTDGDGESKNFTNPAEEGRGLILVQSEYYRAWGDYFEQRTDGNITYDAENETVVVELLSTGFTGPFDMPPERGDIFVRGVSDHSMTELEFTLQEPTNNNADLNNMQWSLHAERGDRQFEIHVRDGNEDDVAGTDCKERTVVVTVYYSPPDGDNDEADPYHGWQKETKTECFDRDGDGSDDEERITVDLMSSDDMNYTSLQSNDVLWYPNPNNNPLIDPVTFDEHPSVGEPRSYSPGDVEDTEFVVNHYMSLLGEGIRLTVADKPGSSVYERGSSGVIEYKGGDRFITYIHLTENNVSVES